MNTRRGRFSGAFLFLLITLLAPHHGRGADNFSDLYQRAETAYSNSKYREADRLARQAAAAALDATPPATNKVILALELAGRSARADFQWDKALDHFTAALGLTDKARDPLEWARVQHGHATAYRKLADAPLAEAELRDALLVRTDKLGPDHPDTLDTRYEVGAALSRQHKFPQAEAEYRAILKLLHGDGLTSPVALKTRNSLAGAMTAQGRASEAEAIYRELIKDRARVLGPDHKETLGSRGNLAALLSNNLHRYSEAQAEWRSLIADRERIFGAEHDETLRTRSQLASAYNNGRQYKEAEAEYRAVLEIQELIHGPDHTGILSTRRSIAFVLKNHGQTNEAEAELRAVNALSARSLGPNNPQSIRDREAVAATLRDQGKLAEAEAEYKEVLKLRESSTGPRLIYWLMPLDQLAHVLEKENKDQEAQDLIRRGLESAGKVTNPAHAIRVTIERLEALREQINKKTTGIK